MKRFFNIILLFYVLSINAQVQPYYIDNFKFQKEKNVVFCVEDMQPKEIELYNNLGTINDTIKLCEINKLRSYNNLVNSPATIIQFYFEGQITEEDSIPNAIGANNIFIKLMNTTTKTIKEIKFIFIFENHEHKQVYDIKTGKEKCILTFNNLKGRQNLETINDLINWKDPIECYHLLNMTNISHSELFYNNKSEYAILENVFIKYEDGTISNNIRSVITNYNKDLLNDGPLNPYITFLNTIFKNE